MSGAVHDLAEALRAAEAISVNLQEAAGRMTEAAAKFGGLQINDVLWSGSGQLDANGQWNRNFKVPYAAVAVTNRQGFTLYAVAETTGQQPGPGPGTITVPPGSFTARNIAGRSLQILGPVGASFDVEVLARPVTPTCQSAGDSNVMSRAIESVTPLGGAATFNGTPVDTLVSTNGVRFRGFGASDQAGTVNLQQSADDVTWFTTVTEPLGAGFTTGTVVESITVLRFVRVQIVNGAVAQNQFLCASSVIGD